MLIDATVGLEEYQVALAVRVCVEPSEYVPVALNRAVAPAETLGAGGVTAIDTSVAAVTVSAAVPEMVPDVAVMVAAPTARPVADPFEPAALLMTAIAALDELHVMEPVRSWVDASE